MHDKASKADLRAGRQTLDGKQALAYSRARKSVAGGDFGRSANQGLVVLAAAAMARLAGPAALPPILTRAAPSLQTDLSAEQVLTFAASLYVTDPRRVGNRVAKGGFDTTSGGASIVRLDGQARRLLRRPARRQPLLRWVRRLRYLRSRDRGTPRPHG